VSAQILEWIDPTDTIKVVRDQIAAILLLEQANQQVLAPLQVPPKDPELSALRVFVGRSNPWAEFTPSPEQIDATPIVNVSVANDQFDERSSNVVERQKTEALFNIDCYGYGVSATDGGAGHIPGDAKAEDEALRAGALVRKILMAGHYTYLGLRGTVWRRWLESRAVLEAPPEVRAVEHVVCMRLVLKVQFNETAPQVQGATMDTINIEVKRTETGEVLFDQTIEVPPPP